MDHKVVEGDEKFLWITNLASKGIRPAIISLETEALLSTWPEFLRSNQKAVNIVMRDGPHRKGIEHCVIV